MGISDIPILSMLRTRLEWHQARQKVLAENIANADTVGFKPRDLTQPNLDRAAEPASSIALARTETTHLAGGIAEQSQFRAAKAGGYEIRPTGNSVSLEDEMMKVATNQMDFQAASALYSKSLGLLKTALGKR